MIVWSIVDPIFRAVDDRVAAGTLGGNRIFTARRVKIAVALAGVAGISFNIFSGHLGGE